MFECGAHIRQRVLVDIIYVPGRRSVAVGVTRHCWRCAARGTWGAETSLTAWLTRAATYRKGTFYIYKRPTVTSPQRNNSNVSLIRLSFNTMSLVARASCTGYGVAGHCWRSIDQATCFRADVRVKVCNAPGKRVNVVSDRKSVASILRLPDDGHVGTAILPGVERGEPHAYRAVTQPSVENVATPCCITRYQRLWQCA